MPVPQGVDPPYLGVVTDQGGPVHLVAPDGVIVCGAKSTRQWVYGSYWEFDSSGRVLTISPSLLGRGAHACKECVRIAEKRRSEAGGPK